MNQKIKKKPCPPPPPLGNQRGVGHGRPPNPGFSDEEIIQLGEDLLTWIEKCDKESISIFHLSEYYSEIKKIAYSQWVSICARPCFLFYYERAKDWMGKKILKNDSMPTAYGSRFLGIYFKEVREHEREVIEHKIDYEASKRDSNEAPKAEDLDLKQKLYAALYENEQMKKQLNDLKSQASQELQRSDTSL